MCHFSNNSAKSRRGVIAVFAAILIVVLMGMVAFAVDVGYMSLTRTQLQSAADASALAAAASVTQGDMVASAQAVATANYAGGRNVNLLSSDVESGSWDTTTRTFTPSTTTINAARVTVRTSPSTGGATPLFFARVLGWSSHNQSASAVATVNPRDICFVVDLSGSMNYDTRPDRADSSEKVSLIQKVYTDFGWGSYPGTSQPLAYYSVGSLNGSGITSLRDNLLGTTTYKNTIYFTGTKKSKTVWGRTTYYYVDSNGVTVLDNATRDYRAYSWVIDIQIGQTLMPNALPNPDSTNATSRAYWLSYINDDIGANEKGWYYPIDSRLGYASYLQFLMVCGRDSQPGGSYTSMSVNNTTGCQYHSEPTDAGDFNFPAQEQPTHAARRSIIAALNIVKERNKNITDTNQKDWVSIITYDRNNTSSITVLKSLTDNYLGVMQAATKMQACYSGNACTCTEGGLIAAYNHIKPTAEGGSGRKNVNKIVVLLTDGVPNLRQTTDTPLANYISAFPSPYWPTGSNESAKCQKASVMQAAIMKGKNWYLYPVGLGLGSDASFMDKMACMSATADKFGKSFTSTDATRHEENLKTIFNAIITRPKLRLVQ